MSTRLMADCWPLRMPPTPKAVLISLADQANDQGFCWPKVETIALRTCLSERAVRNAIRWLEEAALLRVSPGEMRSNVYTLTPHHYAPQEVHDADGGSSTTTPTATMRSPRWTPGHQPAPRAAFAGFPQAPEAPGIHSKAAPRAGQPAPAAGQPARRAAQVHARGAFEAAPDAAQPARGAPQPALGAGQTGTSCPLTIREPIQKTNPQPPEGADDLGIDGPDETRQSRNKPLVSLATFIAECRQKGERPIPDTDPVFDYCQTVGIDRDILLLHWREFKARRAEGKRQRDWRQTFRNSVRDNWFRLWFLKPGEGAQLTTQGLQALAVMQREQSQQVDRAHHQGHPAHHDDHHHPGASA
jgi:hypothetical protein